MAHTVTTKDFMYPISDMAVPFFTPHVIQVRYIKAKAVPITVIVAEVVCNFAAIMGIVILLQQLPVGGVPHSCNALSLVKLYRSWSLIYRP